MNDTRGLKAHMSERKYDINAKDAMGNTCLHLAAMLGRSEIIDILLNDGARATRKSRNGFTPVDEAASYGDFLLLKRLWTAARDQTERAVKLRMREVRAAIVAMKDMHFQLDWRFRSWIPFLSGFCPSDTISVWTRGPRVRFDFTLTGLKSYRWQRGDCAFLFKLDRSTASIALIDNKKRVYSVLDDGDPDDEPTRAQRQEILDREVSQIMSTPLVGATVPDGLEFKRSVSGWIFQSEKTDTVAGYPTKVYSIDNLVVRRTVRFEHMTREEIEQWREEAGKVKTASQLVSTLKEAKENDEKRQTSGEDEEDPKRNRDHAPFKPHPSLAPPPKPSQERCEAYMRAASSSAGPTAAPDAKSVHIGRRMIVEESAKTLSPEVHLCEKFPISKAMVMTILNLVAPHHPNIRKLLQFMKTRMPEGFPVKMSLPVFPTITANVTISKCKIGRARDIPDGFFEVPSSYSRVNVEEILG